MSTTYERADNIVRETARKLVYDYHPQLIEAQVRIDFLFAFAEVDEEGQPMADALKLNGYPCAAIARITPLKDRAKGLGDGEIVLDGHQWARMDAAERRALLDHELQHFEVKLDSISRPQFDDLGRPKLTMRKHDRQFGWFDEIARRHGAASIEVQQARELAGEAGQTYFDFAGSRDVAAAAGGSTVTRKARQQATEGGREVREAHKAKRRKSARDANEQLRAVGADDPLVRNPGAETPPHRPAPRLVERAPVVEVDDDDDSPIDNGGDPAAALKSALREAQSRGVTVSVTLAHGVDDRPAFDPATALKRAVDEIAGPPKPAAKADDYEPPASPDAAPERVERLDDEERAELAEHEDRREAAAADGCCEECGEVLGPGRTSPCAGCQTRALLAQADAAIAQKRAREEAAERVRAEQERTDAETRARLAVAGVPCTCLTPGPKTDHLDVCPARGCFGAAPLGEANRCAKCGTWTPDAEERAAEVRAARIERGDDPDGRDPLEDGVTSDGEEPSDEDDGPSRGERRAPRDSAPLRRREPPRAALGAPPR